MFVASKMVILFSFLHLLQIVLASINSDISLLAHSLAHAKSLVELDLVASEWKRLYNLPNLSHSQLLRLRRFQSLLLKAQSQFSVSPPSTVIVSSPLSSPPGSIFPLSTPSLSPVLVVNSTHSPTVLPAKSSSIGTTVAQLDVSPGGPISPLHSSSDTVKTQIPPSTTVFRPAATLSGSDSSTTNRTPSVVEVNSETTLETAVDLDIRRVSEPTSRLDSPRQESTSISSPAGHRNQPVTAKTNEGKGHPDEPTPFPLGDNSISENISVKTSALPKTAVPSIPSTTPIVMFGSAAPNNQQTHSSFTDFPPNIGADFLLGKSAATVVPMSSTLPTLNDSSNNTTAVLYSGLLVPKNLPLSSRLITITLFSAFSIVTGCLAVAAISSRSKSKQTARDPSSLYANSVRSSRERRAKTDVKARAEFLLSTSLEGTSSRFTSHSEETLSRFPWPRPTDDEGAQEPREADPMVEIDLHS